MYNGLMKKVFVLLGENVEFGTNVVNVLIESHSVQVSGLLGVSAFDVYANIQRLHPDSTSLIKLVSKRKPWEDQEFWHVVNGSTLGVNGGIEVLVPQGIIEKCKIINLHPSFLPFNKGSHQAFWSIMNATPMGGSIHWMNNGMDAGPIIARKLIQDDGYIISEQLQKKSQQICVDLLKEKITDILADKVEVINNDPGDLHLKNEIRKASTLYESETYTGKFIWNLIRATRNGSHGFWIKIRDKEFHIKVTISADE